MAYRWQPCKGPLQRTPLLQHYVGKRCKVEENTKMACEKSCFGPGFATPMDAFNRGTREKIIYVPCVVPDASRPDYLAVVDIDKESDTYCKVIHRTPVTHLGDEVHHMNWNSCSSCFDNPCCKRDKLILPCLNSSRIYVFDLAENPLQPKLLAEVDTKEMQGYDLSVPHTPHCLPNGHVMISTMGNAKDEPQGSFILLDGKSFSLKRKWGKESVEFGYDFWYQPRHDVMISSGWGAPFAFKKGFNPEDINKGLYSDTIYVWKWSTEELLQKIKLGNEGMLPLEVRFFHQPDRAEGYVGCALSGTIWRFFKNENNDKWEAEKVAVVPSRQVNNWALPQLPAIISDILISMDDRYLYAACWLSGEIMQYDVSKSSSNIRLNSKIFLGGVLYKNGPVQAADDQEMFERRTMRNVEFRGGPQMLQLSLDGKRLYGTTSLYSAWDKQFYPELIQKGAIMFRVEVDSVSGKMTLDEDFVVDFGTEPEGPVLAHELRYPGGDCTSDIWK